MFYTARTKDCDGKLVDGLDRLLKLTCGFSTVFVGVMPHIGEAERIKADVNQLHAITVQTLQENKNAPASVGEEVIFHAFGKSDADVCENNLLKVMLFALNHTSLLIHPPGQGEWIPDPHRKIELQSWAQFRNEAGQRWRQAKRDCN